MNRHSYPPGWGPDPNFRLIGLFRQKLSLIRLSRRKFTLIRHFRPKVFWSDHLQTMVQTQILTIAQTIIRLWSGSSALEEVMIRPSYAQSIYGQTQLRLQPFMIRLKCARDQFWSDSSALELVWSEKMFFMKKPPSFAIIYSFHKNWCLPYSIHLRKNQIKSIAKGNETQLFRTNFILYTVQCILLTQWMSLDSFPYETSWSPLKHRGSKFLLKWTASAISWTPFSHQSYRTYDGSLIRTLLCGCLLAEPTSLSKKKLTKIMRSKWFLIRPDCVQKLLWSDPSALEEVKIRPKCGRSRFWSDKSALEEVMIRPNCARIRLWSDFSDPIDL